MRLLWETRVTGLSQTKSVSGKMQVRVQLRSGEAMFLLVAENKINAESWKYLEKSQSPIEITGPWKLIFTEEGAAIPTATELLQLVSWTDLPDQAAQNFSGSGRYSTAFELSGTLSGEYLLDLGKVCESAHVWVNGQDTGILWNIPFTARVRKFLKSGTNTIEIEVANLMANRIRQMDKQKVQWRNYHEINFVNIDYKPFDASGWKPMPSGLLGPVRLIPYN